MHSVWWPEFYIEYAIESMLIVGASKRALDGDSLAHKQSVNQINRTTRLFAALLPCAMHTMNRIDISIDGN